MVEGSCLPPHGRGPRASMATNRRIRNPRGAPRPQRDLLSHQSAWSPKRAPRFDPARPPNSMLLYHFCRCGASAAPYGRESSDCELVFSPRCLGVPLAAPLDRGMQRGAVWHMRRIPSGAADQGIRHGASLPPALCKPRDAARAISYSSKYLKLPFHLLSS